MTKAMPASLHRNIITLTVMCAAVLEVLDMTIVNVALPQMMGELGANSETITWVLTAYIVSSAIVMTITGNLIQLLGQKRLLLLSLVGFMCSSMLCGFSESLAEAVFFRMFQGIFGASLVPLSQYILEQIYSEQEHQKAMAIWGMGIMSGPVLGPALGGYLTLNFSWNMVFFVNIPICLLACFLTVIYVPQTRVKIIKIDYIGFILLALAITALQIFLDQGNNKQWFESGFIQTLFATFLISFIVFIIRGIKKKDNIVPLAMFRDRNFSCCTVLLACYVACLIGLSPLQPLMLEKVMNYPTDTSGYVLAPRGIASAITMILTVKIGHFFSQKKLIIIGILFTFIGTLYMTTFRISTPMHIFIAAGLIQGVGMGLFFVPISHLSLSTLSPSLKGAGAGFFSVGRSIGSSIGISALATIMFRMTQTNWHSLGTFIQPYNHNLNTWLNQHHWQLDSSTAMLALTSMLDKNAQMNAFVDCFMLSAYGYLLILPIAFLLKEKTLKK